MITFGRLIDIHTESCKSDSFSEHPQKIHNKHTHTKHCTIWGGKTHRDTLNWQSKKRSFQR